MTIQRANMCHIFGNDMNPQRQRQRHVDLKELFTKKISIVHQWVTGYIAEHHDVNRNKPHQQTAKSVKKQ